MPELNGQHGVVVSEKPNDQYRWEIGTMHGNELRMFSFKPANLRWVGLELESRESQKPVKFSGFAAMVASERRGGEVEFSKVLSLKPDNLEAPK